jgi:hypothetical protein
LALAAVRAVTAYLDGELCGVGDDGLPNFAETQAATDGVRGVREGRGGLVTERAE